MPKGVGVRFPPLAHNISDLAPKTMQTNADKALECRQNADKFYLYYSLHGKGNDITETREWGDFTWRVSDCEELVGVTHRR